MFDDTLTPFATIRRLKRCLLFRSGTPQRINSAIMSNSSINFLNARDKVLFYDLYSRTLNKLILEHFICY